MLLCAELVKARSVMKKTYISQLASLVSSVSLPAVPLTSKKGLAPPPIQLAQSYHRALSCHSCCVRVRGPKELWLLRDGKWFQRRVEPAGYRLMQETKAVVDRSSWRLEAIEYDPANFLPSR